MVVLGTYFINEIILSTCHAFQNNSNQKSHAIPSEYSALEVTPEDILPSTYASCNQMKISVNVLLSFTGHLIFILCPVFYQTCFQNVKRSVLLKILLDTVSK